MVPNVIQSMIDGTYNTRCLKRLYFSDEGIDQLHVSFRILPHPRTLRKARTQVQLRVASGFSTRRIKSYLQRFFRWWVTTTELWTYEELITWF